MLKIGTTNDLDRRRSEHNRNYKKSPEHTMPENGKFEYLWSLPLSKYNTLRYEDKNRELWKNMGITVPTRLEIIIATMSEMPTQPDSRKACPQSYG